MQTVVLDTNALLMPFEIKMNLDLALRELLGEARIVVPKYEIVPTVTTGDNSVMELAKKTGGYVLTNDKELRRRLRKEKIPIIFLRSGTHLAVDTYLGEEI